MGNLASASRAFGSNVPFSASAEDMDAQEAYELFVLHSGNAQNGFQPESLPPVQTVINDSIAFTAADQIKENQEMVNESAKKLVTEFLSSRKAAVQSGMFLGSLFRYESILQPTRDLVYWSLHLPTTYNPIFYQAKAGLLGVERGGIQMISSLAASWLVHPETRKHVISPLLTWTIRQEDITVQPLTDLVTETIPEYKEATTQAIKGLLLDYIRSDEAKEVAREGIMQYLSKRTPRAEAGEQEVEAERSAESGREESVPPRA